MPFAVDLHIHSCLSPCASDDMTPNNIVGMAYIKGLDAIAVTDHNGAKNLPAVKKVADQYGVVLLPGIEVATSEDIHVLCYFQTVEAALDFGDFIESRLLPIANKPELFGNQIIMNEQDEEIGRFGPLLIQGADIAEDELPGLVMERGGVCVPAHINRKANSMVTTLGFMPLDRPYAGVEVSRDIPMQGDTGELMILHSSDAHYLGDILERDFFLRFEEKTTASLMAYLKAHIR